MTGRLFALVAATALTATALAGPLKTQRVGVDAEWMMHIDVERLTSSTVGRFVLEHSDDFDLDLDEVEAELGIDPTEDLFSVTIYGDGHPEEDATVVLEISGVIDDVIDTLEDEEGYERLVVDGHVVHRWEDGDATYAHVISAADPGRRIVVLAGSADSVVAAAEVIEGRRPSLRRAIEQDRVGGFALPRSGSIVYAFARGLPWIEPGDDPASTIARRSDRMRLELREADEVTSIDLLISARSSADARNVTDVLRGLIALSDLLSDQDPELEAIGELRDYITVSGEDNDVRVVLRAESEELRRCLDDVVDD